jgi:hypothetical protein
VYKFLCFEPYQINNYFRLESLADPSSERHLMSFTLRDSPTDFINATWWGGQEFIQDLSSSFRVGDISESSLN